MSGSHPEFMKKLCPYWAEHFYWQTQLVHLSLLPHFRLPRVKARSIFCMYRATGLLPYHAS
jgi:hypothetical protein